MYSSAIHNNKPSFTNNKDHIVMNILICSDHSFIEGTEQVADLLQTALRKFLVSLNHLHRVLGLALLRILHFSLLPLHLKTLFKSLASSFRISEIKSPHLDGLSGSFGRQCTVISKIGLIVVHDGSKLFLPGFVEDDGHGLQYVLFHAFGVGNCGIDFACILVATFCCGFVLVFELFEHAAFVFIDDFVEMTVIFFHFCLLFLQRLHG